VERLDVSGIQFVVNSYFLQEERMRRDILPAGSSEEVEKLVASTPGAIGFLAGTAARGSGVKRLALDGVQPTAENVQNNSYPLLTRSRIILARNPRPSVEAFARLVTGGRFANRLQALGFVPLIKGSDAAISSGEARAPEPSSSNPWEMLGLSLAGIGLFLVGVRFVSNSLKRMANRRLRMILARWTKSPFLGAVWGILCGAVSQSGTSSGFLLAGFVASGMLPLRNAMFILSWSEVGTSLLVFVATAGIKLVILYFLAFSAIALSLDKRWKYDSIVTACMGLGLLLFGFDMVTSAAVKLTELVWIQRLMGVTANSLLLLFFLGAALRVATQSSSAVAILSIPLMNSGILSLPQCIAMVCGTSLGGALAGLLLSGDLKGLTRQLILHKGITDTFSGVFFFGLLLVNDGRGEPLLIKGLGLLATSVGGRIAFMFLAARLLPTLISFLFGKPLRALVERFSPVTPEEELAQFKYLNDQVLENPESAIELAALESGRIMERLPRYLDAVRQEEAMAEICGASPLDRRDDRTGAIKLDDLHNASSQIGKEINDVLTDLFSCDVGYESSERLLQVQNRHQAVMDLAATVRDLVDHLKANLNVQGLDTLCFSMGEGLHAMLHLAAETAASADADDYELLLQLTSDNGNLMESVRNSYLQKEENISSEAREALLRLTNCFQRAVWLLHRWTCYGAAKLPAAKE
jgi:phosphate:Na+ symporter